MLEMSDRELLELAAKAADLEINSYSDSGLWIKQKPIPGLYPTDRRLWNPLTDDGDALRLAVKLDMVLLINRVDEWTDVEFGYSVKDVRRLREGHGSNPYAATRRAIVRAAAEIGKSMEEA
jgi:hypothetical protein